MAASRRVQRSRMARASLAVVALVGALAVACLAPGALAAEPAAEPLGTVIGWPIYMSAMILANNFWGWATGEWRRAGARAVLLMGSGILVQIVAMVLFGRMR